ncbi:ThiF family adenylyltransferase [Neisseria canis]|nr:ThiF family adenylyltransferase [Neisseria canis]
MANIRSKIIKTLIPLGYKLVSITEISCNAYNTNRDYPLFFKKKIDVGNTSIEFLLNFSDFSLLSFPSVYLSSGQLDRLQMQFSHIKQPIPHLTLSSILYINEKLFSICYQLDNESVVPRTDLKKLVALVEQYLYTFFSKLVDKEKYVEEYTVDFGGVIIGLVNATNPEVKQWPLMKRKPKFLFDGEKEIFILEISEDKKPDFTSLLNSSNKVTIEKLINCIQKWDNNAYGILMHHLKKKQPLNKLVISWKNFLAGIAFEWPREEGKSLKSQDNIILLQNPVTFHNILLVDFKSSVLRNLPTKFNQGLLDKKVFQVGLGAVGGYVADALVKIGAGLEKKFTIVDNDTLKIENIGRHLLGFEYLDYHYKAAAFKAYIQKQTFYKAKHIETDNRNINNYSSDDFQRNKFDLIIDATGSIEVQEYINEVVQSIPISERPIILHLWVFGNGECVQGLWVQPSQQHPFKACIACLGSSGSGLHPDYIPVADLSPEQGVGVCSAYTPYAVSCGMMAASLGVNMILEWCETGKVVNNYQTRYSSHYHGKQIPDSSVPVNPLCPFYGVEHE